jgi:hypothetical protein
MVLSSRAGLGGRSLGAPQTGLILRAIETEKKLLLMNDPKTKKLEPENLAAEKLKAATPNNPEPRESNAPAMAGLAIAVVLLVVGLWLAHELRAASKMQDCVLSGRTNCNVIQP